MCLASTHPWPYKPCTTAFKALNEVQVPVPVDSDVESRWNIKTGTACDLAIAILRWSMMHFIFALLHPSCFRHLSLHAAEGLRGTLEHCCIARDQSEVAGHVLHVCLLEKGEAGKKTLPDQRLKEATSPPIFITFYVWMTASNLLLAAIPTKILTASTFKEPCYLC